MFLLRHQIIILKRPKFLKHKEVSHFDAKPLLLNNAIERYIGEQQFDLNFYKKLVELKAVADSSLLLQQYNASFNQTMLDKVFHGIEVGGVSDWQ